jgi:3-oxo-5alpha-steroid 4-dehydrogenase
MTQFMSQPRDLVDRRQILRASAAAIAAISASATDAVAAPPTVKKWDHEFDVVIIGFGVSGACAAQEAVQTGAKVLVLDRASAAGNESHGTYIYMGGGTALQRAYKVEDTPDEMLKYLLSANGPEPDKNRIQIYVERSIPDFDWLVSLGVPFSDDPSDGSLSFTGNELAYPSREMARPAPRGHSAHVAVTGSGAGMRGGGAWLQKRLLELTRQAGVTQLLAANARQLVRGSDGVVQGVLAEIDGTVQAFRAKRGVILATGGFALNREMVAQHAPIYLNCTPIDVSANDGWGIRAGQSVGAAVKRMGAADATWTLYPPLSRKQGILINAQGQRFVPEDSYFGRIGDAIVREQHGVAYLVLDAVARGDRPGILPEKIVIEAKTISEVERALGIAEPALQQTLDVYNRYAARGEDPFFHKAKDQLRPLVAPFTAINASVGNTVMSFFTLGGLMTNPKGEVLDTDGAWLPHLYAVGRTSAGIPCPYYYSSGLSLGECVTFGRIAGRNAAANRGI